MADNHNHDAPSRRLLYSGQSDASKIFQEVLNNPLNFDITCAECCRKYLVRERGYNSSSSNHTALVIFGKHIQTSCYVDGPQGYNGKNYVVKTGHDLNLGVLKKHPVADSCLYQLYAQPNIHHTPMALGVPMTVRIEAIAVKIT